MIFKKTAMQGNFILSNGNQILFKNSHYETQDDVEIAQLTPIYEVVTEQSAIEVPIDPKPIAALAKTGMASSATLLANTK